MLLEMKAGASNVCFNAWTDAERTPSDVARSIVPLLEENRQSCAVQACVRAAQTQPTIRPHMLSGCQKMSIIVPNNRLVATQLKAEMDRFDKDQQKVISTFLLRELPELGRRRDPLCGGEALPDGVRRLRGLADAGA